jgi:hypothetical protein
MGFAPEYHGYRFMQDSATNMQDAAPSGGKGKGKDFEFDGTVTWAVDIARVYALGHAGLVSNWNARGYKIGLLLLEGQTIESFVYGGASLQSIPAATADLDGAFGTPPGHRWTGWGRPSGEREFGQIPPNVVTFKVHVRLAGAGPACQLIPVALRHWQGSFSESMPSLWVVRR